MTPISKVQSEIERHLTRHNLRDAIEKTQAEFRDNKLPHLNQYLGFPEATIIDYLMSQQGLPDMDISPEEKQRYSQQILTSLSACSKDNPIWLIQNPEPMVKAIQLLESFETANIQSLSSFDGYDDGEQGLSLASLMDQLTQKQILFCHRICDFIDRCFWSLPADLMIMMERTPTADKAIRVWRINAFLFRGETVLSEGSGVLTTAHFDGLTGEELVEGLAYHSKEMARLGEALTHEIKRNALPFDDIDSLFGDEEDNVTGWLHLDRVESHPEYRNIGYARTLILGIGEMLGNLNQMDVITQRENGWKFDDSTTYNPVITRCHTSLVHHVASNFVSLTSISDPTSVLMRDCMQIKGLCNGAAINEAIHEGQNLKIQLLKATKTAASKGNNPLGEVWLHYPEWEKDDSFTSPAGELA